MCMGTNPLNAVLSSSKFVRADNAYFLVNFFRVAMGPNGIILCAC